MANMQAAKDKLIADKKAEKDASKKAEKVEEKTAQKAAMDAIQTVAVNAAKDLNKKVGGWDVRAGRSPLKREKY